MVRRTTRENGSILVMTALMLVVLLGITGMAVDVGSLYDTRNRLATAADAAARSAALVRLSTTDSATLTHFGQDAVTRNGFSVVSCGSTGGVATCINNPPTAGPFAGNSNYVEAILTQANPTYFMRVFGRTVLSVGARAVAGISASSNCIVTLGTSGVGLNVDKQTTINSKIGRAH